MGLRSFCVIVLFWGSFCSLTQGGHCLTGSMLGSRTLTPGVFWSHALAVQETPPVSGLLEGQRRELLESLRKEAIQSPLTFLTRFETADLALRRCAAQALAHVDFADIDALIRVYSAQTDRMILTHLALALGRHESRGFEKFKIHPGFSSALHRRLYLWRRVVFSLDAILMENTDPDGSFKGFYDEQFDRLKDLGSLADEVFFRIAGDATRPSTLRRAAVRALGSTERPSAAVLLRRAREAEIVRHQWIDPASRPAWQMEASAREEFYEDPFLEYLDYARARCGDPVGINQRLEYFQAERDKWQRAMPFADEEQKKGVRLRIAIAWFRIAYCHQHLRDFSRAESLMTMLAVDYADTGYAPISYYNLACMQSRRGEVDKALGSLDAAIRAGYLDAEWIHKDGDLANLRKDIRFNELMRKWGMSRTP